MRVFVFIFIYLHYSSPSFAFLCPPTSSAFSPPPKTSHEAVGELSLKTTSGDSSKSRVSATPPNVVGPSLSRWLCAKNRPPRPARLNFTRANNIVGRGVYWTHPPLFPQTSQKAVGERVDSGTAFQWLSHSSPVDSSLQG